VRDIEQDHGGIDLLVNNAGGDPLREFHTITIEENLRTLQLNLTAPLALSHAVLPGMLDRGRGHIVNISAMAGRVAFPYTEVYAAAKDGLIGFTRVLRAGYHARGVSASVLILGAIRGAGQGQRMLDEAEMKASAYMAPAESVARAVVKAVEKDKPELIVMPGPGRLLRALLDYFPGWAPLSTGPPGQPPPCGKSSSTGRPPQTRQPRSPRHAPDSDNRASNHPVDQLGTPEPPSCSPDCPEQAQQQGPGKVTCLVGVKVAESRAIL
jgi:hypothetical protein